MNAVANVEITERLKELPFAETVSAAADIVSEAVGPSVTQLWDVLSGTEGDQVIRLQLGRASSDSLFDSLMLFKEEATADFSPGELRLPEHLKTKVRDLKEALGEVALWGVAYHTLCVDVKRWLSELDENVYTEWVDCALHERRAGHYHVPGLRVRYGSGEMLVRPVARWVLGADLRVDLISNDERFVLLLLGLEWHWIDGRSQRLDRDLFLKLARACLGLEWRTRSIRSSRRT